MIAFFQPDEETRIISAIRAAEQQTSGEIRVHIEKNAKGKIMNAAVRTFKKLDMHKTEARNGVLIFLAPERREFAIIGDEGINKLVGEGFWREERDLMQSHFKQGAFCEGVCEVIEQIGEKLKAHFPFQKGDENELSDEVSYG